MESVDQQNFDKLQTAYDACLDEDTVKSRGVAPLLDLLNETSHRLLSASAGTEKPLTDAITYLANLGISAFVAAGTGADDRDPDSVVISVAAPYSIGLPAKELYKDKKITQKYEDVVSQVISALYPEKATKIDSHGLVEFEKKLAAASPDAEDRDDVTVSVPIEEMCYNADMLCRNTTTQ